MKIIIIIIDLSIALIPIFAIKNGVKNVAHGLFDGFDVIMSSSDFSNAITNNVEPDVQDFLKEYFLDGKDISM